MAQTLTTESTSQPAMTDREIQATTVPIISFTTPTAKPLSIAHPLILAGYLYLRFGALVANPASTLLFDLAPVTLFQAGHAAVCLPLSRRTADIDHVKQTTSTKTKSTKSKASKVLANEAGVGTRISNVLLSLLLAALASIPIFVILVLFGAPLTTHHSQTLLCAVHFSLLAVFPLFYTHGVDRQAWWEIGGAMLPFDSVWGTTIGCALGAWLGAVPIPLDWDREWQKWPVTIVAGMYIGALLGNFIGRYILFGKRIRFGNAFEDDKLEVKKTS